VRTTIDLDPAILRELKQRQAEEGKTLGQLVSELLAPMLKRRAEPEKPPFVWRTTNSGTLVDLEDKEAVWKILDER
jgi:hypothetical protein